jgi:thiaminase
MSDDQLAASPAGKDEGDNQSLALRHKTQEKLLEACEKLTLARKELENATADMSTPRYNPFSRSTASLKQMASELQAAPPPVLSPKADVISEVSHEPTESSSAE